MIVRRLEKKDLFEAARVSWIAFHDRVPDPEAQRAQLESEPYENWGAFTDEGVLMARIVNNRFQSHLRGRIVENGGIGGVSTLPEYRESGAVRAIFYRLLPCARANGEVISTLYPFNHAFYRKFGYDTVAYKNEFTFAPDQLRGFRHRGWARQWQPGEPVTPFTEIYNGFAEGLSLSILRDDRQMALSHVRGDCLKDRKFVYLLGEGDAASAYVAFRDEFQPRSAKLVVSEAAWRGRDGFYAVLGFLARFSADYGEITLPLPTGLDLRPYVDDPFALTLRSVCNYMIRVVNVPRALTLLAPPQGESVVLRVQGDEQIPENNGTWRVCGGKAEACESEPDLTVSCRALGQLLCGALDLSGALLRPDVAVQGREETLKRLFAKQAIYVGDFF